MEQKLSDKTCTVPISIPDMFMEGFVDGGARERVAGEGRSTLGMEAG